MQLRLWWWRKVRRANIPQILRDEFEQYGETVIVGALTSIIDGASTPMQALILKWQINAVMTHWRGLLSVAIFMSGANSGWKPLNGQF
jgi:hypothetical protein